MSGRDWSAGVANPEALREVLGFPPPPLSDYDVTSVLIDERGASVTLRFFAFAVPAGAAELWQARGHNAVEFTLFCTGVENLEVDGWSGWPRNVPPCQAIRSYWPTRAQETIATPTATPNQAEAKPRRHARSADARSGQTPEQASDGATSRRFGSLSSRGAHDERAPGCLLSQGVGGG